jgi:hypothetical protein
MLRADNGQSEFYLSSPPGASGVFIAVIWLPFAKNTETHGKQGKGLTTDGTDGTD